MQAMETLKRKSADDLDFPVKKQHLEQVPLFFRDCQAMENLKRKYADDFEFGVKKRRTDFSYVEPLPGMGIDNNAYDFPVLPPEVDMLDPNLPAAPVDAPNELAIVLYKPYTPEVFGVKNIPRAPPAIRLDDRILTTGVLNDSELLRRFGILSTISRDQSIDSKNNLALIPWVDPSSAIMLPNQGTVSESSFDALGNRPNGDDEMRANNMLELEETMEEDMDNVDVNKEYMNQPNNAVRIQPCQLYELSQPQFSSVM